MEGLQMWDILENCDPGCAALPTPDALLCAQLSCGSEIQYGLGGTDFEVRVGMRDALDMAAFTLLIVVLLSSSAHPFLPHIRSQLDKANSPCPSKLVAEWNPNRVRRRSIGDPNRFAIYVNGSIGLRLGESAWKRFASRIRSELSIEMWLRIEGGQPDSATIFAFGDICGKESAAASVRLAIETDGGGEHKARIVAQLATQMAIQPTTLKSELPWSADEWLRVSLAYSGHEFLLYINGARVAKSRKQSGAIYSLVRSACKRLFIATDGRHYGHQELVGFRGSIASIRISDHYLNHSQIVQQRWQYTVFEDRFTTLNQWRTVGINEGLQHLTIDNEGNPLNVEIPPCGQTICDNPHVVLNYQKYSHMRSPKRLRYRIVVVTNDDGSNPIISKEQIDTQHAALTSAFAAHNISWDREIVEIHNSSLRRKTIVFGCRSSSIGNNRCDIECRHPITGDDGGDCKQNTQCLKHMANNKRCDVECNTREYNWDNGECCGEYDPDDNKYCIDPASPYRRYINVDEYKELIGLNNENCLNVQFAEWSPIDLIGLSTFPWEKEVYSNQGGILLRSDRFGSQSQINNLIHEVGHVLGLWHVHHGVSEVPCGDPCQETIPSMTTGDLVNDTKPTTKNTQCSDPIESSPCDNRHFTDTPYRNFMSYASGTCSNTFTAQQVARMHCYADMKYENWMQRNTSRIYHIPLGPRIVPLNDPAKPSSIAIKWSAPLGGGNCRPTGSRAWQTYCTADNRIVQYAISATSSGPFQMSGYWGPEQATGPPDAESCAASTKAWLPDVQSCDDGTDKCTLKVHADIDTQLEKLSIWIAWNAASGVRTVKVIYSDDSFHLFEQIFAHCDQPLTLRLNSDKVVKEVQIRTNNPFVSVDAVQFISPPSDPRCSPCSPFEYHVYRSPSFDDSKPVRTKQHHIIDRSIKEGIRYEYSVTVLSNGTEGIRSPPTSFVLNQNVCGDGIRAENEECDDGNFEDGDGCSQQCIVENNFHCFNTDENSSSLCYIYDGDGECEVFERALSTKDCGIFVPPGYRHHFPNNIYAHSTSIDFNCSMLHLLSIPQTTGCHVMPLAWGLCSPLATETISVNAEFSGDVFPSSVIVNIAAIVTNDFGSATSTLGVELIHSDNSITTLEEQIISSCSQNPIEFAIAYTLLKKPLVTHYVRVTISNPLLIAVSSIILRSSKTFDLFAIQKCTEQNRYFDPSSGECIVKECGPLRKGSCPPINIPHSKVSCESATVCVVRCVVGYALRDSVDSASLVCIDGEWAGDTNIVCEPVRCGVPRIEHAIIDCPHGTGYNERCTFTCKPTTVMIGTENEVICGEKGLWSPPEAFCQTTCPHDDLLKRNVSQETIVCKSTLPYATQESHPVSTVCRMNCLRHYRVSQTSHTRLRLTCSEDGVWIGQSCHPITCPPPKVVYVGLYNCSNGFVIGSRCVFRCPGAPQPKTLICRTNGAWSQRFQCYPQQASCKAPARMRDINTICPNRMVPGSTCAVSCGVKGYDAVTEEKQILPNGESLLILRTVTNISCTVSSILYPRPSSLLCVRSCNKEFVGDGWCDFQNNRGYCRWDNGDCCASTVRGGRVRLMFPSLCTSQLCQCIDPFAIENTLLPHRPNTNITINSLRERKSAIKRAARLFRRHLNSLSELRYALERFVTVDGSLPLAADSVALLRHARHVEHSLFGSLNKQFRASNISQHISFERIIRSVKQALHWRQKQFYNKV